MSDRDNDELLAAELAFGLLEHGDRAAADARVIADGGFAERYRWWLARAVALLDGRDVAPPESVWQAIGRRLPANTNRPDALRWKVATAVAAAVALMLGSVLLLKPAPDPVRVEVPAPRTLVAVLASAERDDVVAVDFDPRSRLLSARPAALAAGAGDAELWVIPVGGKPVAVGLLPARGRLRLNASPRLAALITPGATLAISLEPRGGSTTGAPTGPVILTGKIAQS